MCGVNVLISKYRWMIYEVRYVAINIFYILFIAFAFIYEIMVGVSYGYLNGSLRCNRQFIIYDVRETHTQRIRHHPQLLVFSASHISPTTPLRAINRQSAQRRRSFNRFREKPACEFNWVLWVARPALVYKSIYEIQHTRRVWIEKCMLDGFRLGAKCLFHKRQVKW